MKSKEHKNILKENVPENVTPRTIERKKQRGIERV